MATKLKQLLNLSCTAGMFFITTASANDNQPPPEWTEIWEPEPKVVTVNPIPSDAIVLLGHDGVSAWEHNDGSPVKWHYANGVMTVNPGTKGIRSKQKFCDMQLHIEWRAPEVEDIDWKKGQHRGNSGIYIQGRYEVQILDSYQNRTYSNGQAGAIYKQTPPLVNATKPPLQWQTYDIIYRAPRFKANGQVDQKAYITVLHNGVLVQNHTQIQGATTYRGIAKYPAAHGCAPIHLQDHSNPVSFKNIWVRPL
ncbi:hypothetical protein DS2_14854 [Catenovulum agarivorans DS-2]|uniref:3-keto-alpha-glucoside-1,2-lyase/3-keto-2-hydroxy-glucal hydratase domain-containing protein n=1 Tax=Catenovulum agarivorans DS-2 TaxID=1328313 RepID=W7QLF8_9ALTE|nr:DUF1080 domain-containing protein [Catenovulum agarivorans]EWH08973.1 hypothetical protein DS2_14854 [Catenovulum agarivorans DS-2]